MNFPSAFLLTWILRMEVVRGNDSFTPLIVLHNLEDQSYELSDLQVIRNRLLLPKGIFDDIDDANHSVTCSEPYEPSVLYIRDTFLYQIGYEISTKYDDPSLDLINESTMWEFGVIISYRIAYSNAIGTKHLVHGGRHSNGEPRICPDLQLGKDYYRSLDFDHLYREETQNENLKNFIRYPKLNTTNQSTQNQHLVPFFLTPIDDFDADSLRKTTCSYLNTVPIWKKIAQGTLQRIEKEIRKVIDEILDKATVWTGTHGILELLVNKEESTSTDTTTWQKVFLNGATQIPVPQLVFKLVLHEAPEYDYAMIIVVHNDFNKRNDTTLCPKVQCSSYGWFTDNEDVFSGQTYCCRPTSEILRLLDVKLNRPHFLDLSLFRPRQASPLTFFYNSVTNRYLIADTEVVKKVQFSPLYHYGFTHVVFCCPAETDLEKEFQKERNVDNVLFIRRVFHVDQSIQAYTLYCQEYYDPVIRYSVEENIHDFGYQIRFDKQTIRDYLFHNVQYLLPVVQDVYFLCTFFLHFNVERFHSTLATHTIQAAMLTSNNPLLTCKHFPLGRHLDLFEGINMAKFYFKEKQRWQFQQMDLSALQPFVQNRFRNTKETPPPYGYLVMHQLIPIQDYNANSMIRGTCTYLNVVPIWQVVSEGSMKTVEMFIRRVANVIGELTVVTGTHEILNLSNLDSPPSRLMKMSIPKALYKWISHSIQVDGNTFYFSILIVVHNEPAELVKKICPSINCQLLGWNVSSKRNINIGTTYCCRPDEAGLQAFGMQPKQNTRLLNLHKVPIEITPDLESMRYMNVAEILDMTDEPVLYRDVFLRIQKFEDDEDDFTEIDDNGDNGHREQQDEAQSHDRARST